jgi:hypothetical protein
MLNSKKLGEGWVNLERFFSFLKSYHQLSKPFKELRLRLGSRLIMTSPLLIKKEKVEKEKKGKRNWAELFFYLQSK